MNHATPPRHGIRRLQYVYGWRMRYWWHDTRAGHETRKALAWLVFLASIAWMLWDAFAPRVPGQPQEAWVFQVVMLVVALLVSYAMAPKPQNTAPQRIARPVVEDGATALRTYGPFWIDSPTLIGWKAAGTDRIRKKAGKSLAFKTKWQTVGHHYKWVFHFGVQLGPVDAVLQFRGGDKAAWSGRIEENGEVTVSNKGLWGGQDGEGGMEGTMSFQFGYQDQMPDPYLAAQLGANQSAFRGLFCATWKGGRWGNSVYPKPAAFLTTRILTGWDNEAPWYPEKAEIPLYTATETRPTTMYITLDRSGSMSGARITVLKEAMQLVINALESWKASTAQSLDVMLVGFSSTSTFIEKREVDGSDWDDLRAFVAGLTASGGTDAVVAYGRATSYFSPHPPRNNVIVAVSDGAMTSVDNALLLVGDMLNTNGSPYSYGDQNAVSMYGVGITTAGSLASFSNQGPPPIINGDNPEELAELVINALLNKSTLSGINPAHVLYDSLTAVTMDGEPVATVNDASLRAAADKLHAEGFGIGTAYDAAQETTDQFQQRICSLIGGRLSRDPVSGEWHLDLLRDDYVLADLPILTDDDILEFAEQPSVMDEAVNQVVWEWHDVMKKEDRSTRPVQALGSIQAFGTINTQTITGREVITETLALRCAARELTARSTPLARHEMKVTRVAYGWRTGQYFRLQAPRHGIEEMVCVLGNINRGTLRSGAISLTSIQHVASMPTTVYAGEESGGSTDPVTTPVPSPAIEAIELPYVVLRASEGAAADSMPAGVGYLGTVAARPADTMTLGYRQFAAADGAAMEETGDGVQEWADHGTLLLDAGHADVLVYVHEVTGFVGFSDGTVLGQLGSGADAELVVIVNLSENSASLKRGVADTVPKAWPAGTRLWVMANLAEGQDEYPAGAVVEARAVTVSSTGEADLASAPTATATIDSRVVRPYPPAALRIAGEVAPAAVTGQFIVAYTQRDRLAQADQLLGQGDPGTGTTEPNYRYAMRVMDADGATLVEKLDIGLVGTPVVDLAYTGQVTLQLWALTDNGDSWQRHERTFDYTAGGATENTITASTWQREAVIIDGGEIE